MARKRGSVTSVTRDLSWQPYGRRRRRPVDRSQRLLVWWLTAALVAINVAVICYHGDPRASLPSARPPARREAARSPTDVGVRAAPGRPTHRAARFATALVHLLIRSAHAAQEPAPAPQAPREGATQTPSADAPDGVPRFVGPPHPLDPLAELRSPGLVQRIERVVLGDGRSPARALLAVGVRQDDVRGIMHGLERVLDARRMRASDVFKVRFDGAGRLVSIELGRGPLDQILLRRQGQTFVAERQRIPVDTVVQEVVGEINTSLWEALVGAGEDPRLAQQLVDIFAYEVDFYTEVRAGDAFRLLVEKRYAHGQFLGYGDMLAAELVVASEVHRAFLYKHGGVSEYFDEHGAAMRKQLLRMPLQYGAVTSRFGRRRHPVLGYTRAHNGVDYGVPIGTPCWSVGEGKVVRAGWHGGYGRLVEVAHPNGWVSQYAHLSHINVHAGQKVRQKQVVGLVGMTGLATGPHLHYGLRHHGHYVNSLAQHFERAKALSGPALATFRGDVGRYMGELDKLRFAHDAKPQGAGNG